MPRPVSRTLRSLLVRVGVGALAASVATAAVTIDSGSRDAARAAGSSGAANPVTPGDFTGYGFDQCHTPDQPTMNRWLQTSPFLAVGVYVSGDSRACRDQPNLTPSWVSNQLGKGWRILPITLGPQASCQPRFPRYGDDETIDPRPGESGRYGFARKQGSAEATKTASVADTLGFAPGSTLWYDLEGFDLYNTRCRESALAFLSSWTWQLHELGWKSGVYSSAGSGIKMLDDARVKRPGEFQLPDQIWIARWDGVANTSTSYIRSDGWQPHARIKQYQGGHDETWGGVKINIDRNYLDVGRGSVAAPETHCDGVRLNYGTYPTLRPATAGDPSTKPPVGRVQALQCLLHEQGLYNGRYHGSYNDATIRAANAWQRQRGFNVQPAFTTKHWMSLLLAGNRPVLKFGSAGPAVRRVQRALNAAYSDTRLRITGVFSKDTDAAVRTWQRRAGASVVSGVVAPESWKSLSAGNR